MNFEEGLKEYLIKKELQKKTPDELMNIYKSWDYKYKPQYSRFIDEVTTILNQQSFVEYLLQVRGQAYYAQSHWECDHGFNGLACLIYIAIIQKIDTPFDHVIKSDKDFEWKLNNLHFKQNK